MDLNLDELLDLIYPPPLDENNASNEIEIIIEPFSTNERQGRSYFSKSVLGNTRNSQLTDINLNIKFSGI